MVVMALILAQKQADFWEFEASLVYIVGFQRNQTLSKKEEEKEREKRQQTNIYH